MSKSSSDVSRLDQPAVTDFSILLAHCPDVIARIDGDMRFTYISPAAETMFKRTVTSLLGRPIADFVMTDDLPIIAAATARLLNEDTEEAAVTVRAIRGDGSPLWVEVTSRRIGLSGAARAPDRAISIRDVSDRKRLEAQLIAMAMKDGLTGLANRRAFDTTLAQESAATVRAGSEMSLMMLDIDHFKEFNDAYGHQVGDDCLRAVGLAALAGVDDSRYVVARYGGEELAVVLQSLSSTEAVCCAERVRQTIEALAIPHHDPSHATRVVTVSVGVATAIARSGGSAAMPHALLTAADRALYRAKAEGRNCVRTAVVIAATDDVTVATPAQ